MIKEKEEERIDKFTKEEEEICVKKGSEKAGYDGRCE